MSTGVDPSRTAQPPRFGQLLNRVVTAGLIAGVVAGVFQLLVTERAIAPGLDIEDARDAASGASAHGGELYTRHEQWFGGFLGTVLAGVLMAVVFGAVYASVRHRLPGRTDVARTAILAAVGFGVFALLPALKIPANPPAVGDPDTVGERTAIYSATLLCGALIAIAVSLLVAALRRRGLSSSAVASAAVGAGIALLAATLLLVPDNPDAIGSDVPAYVVWDFRLASLGQLAVLWTALGLGSGWLLDRWARSPARWARSPAR